MERCDVAIVGGGPVGLLLGCLLAQRGLDVRVLEQSLTRREHSRAVGVHPPGLACLAQAGVAEPVLAHAVRVRRAFAFGDGGTLGQISFHNLPGPYPFVLTVPQNLTERTLEQRLLSLSHAALRRGERVSAVSSSDDGAILTLGSSRSFADEPMRQLRARFVVGCDGKQSAVRSALNIPFRGAAYREHFVMADTADETPFADAAAVFLTRAGLVESFPLPGGIRRWVVGLRDKASAATAELVERLVAERTGQLARARTASMVSAFTAEHFLAGRFAAGPFALAGDAAHVVSPIGGQGMNLGWLDVSMLDEVLAAALDKPSDSTRLLSHYARTRRRAARSAMLRAELFMAIGQTRRLVPLRDLTIRAMLAPLLVQRAAELFTMRGLASPRLS
ncbi:MAG: 2-polyprenyl-6-methoxyphenol hydroxylase-like oxidoreductase [Myxococcaceae bacterium]|nr:2-polyprenyl-6-methoxyphenol hydroxylase-like oxidoreductase [Myxococcaceae bacterium]